MQTQILGADGTSIVNVDATTGAMRVSRRPRANAGWYAIGSGTGAYAAPAANTLVYAIRPTGTRLMRIKSLKATVMNTGTTTAAGTFDFQATVYRGVTATSGGTLATFTDGSGKFNSSFPTPDAEIRTGTTASLAVTAATIDANPISFDRSFFALGAPAIGRVLNHSFIELEDDASAFVLAPNEALVVRTVTVAPAAASINYNFNVVFAMLDAADV